MKLEFLPEGAPECPLIRLYDFTAAEALQMQQAVTDLVDGTAERVVLDSLPWITVVGTAGLTLCISRRDIDLVSMSGSGRFVCRFTAGTLSDIGGLLEPFACGAAEGYQWLFRRPDEFSLLISTDGQW